MKLSTASMCLLLASSVSAFAPSKVEVACPSTSSTTSLNIVVGEDPSVTVPEKLEQIFGSGPQFNAEFDQLVQEHFPNALSNEELVTRVVTKLSSMGYTGANTLLATSLCCDELARQLEDDLTGIYGNNFNLGGLVAGFPFAGNTGFGAMAAHIPDDGYCLIAYGPHVGLAADGTVGKVE